MRTAQAALGILFGKARRQILGLLLPHPKKAIFLREIVRLTGLSPGATQRELTALVSAGILTRAADGRLVYFQANTESPLFMPLRQLFGEPGDTKAPAALPARATRAASTPVLPPRQRSEPQAQTTPDQPERSVSVNPAPPTTGTRVEPFRAALARLQPRIAGAFIYGPADGGDMNADVYLMVVGRVSFAEVAAALTPARAAIAGNISPMVYPADEFRRKLAAGNAFLSAVLEQPRAWIVGDGRAIGVP